MKQKTFLLFLLLTSVPVLAQMGVNTDVPKSTLDVSAIRNSSGTLLNNSLAYGIQAPRLTRAELTANTATYGTEQIGAIIYITDISTGNTNGNRVNIDSKGYYYFDGNLWQKLTGSSSGSNSITADNGLTLSSYNVQLGGTLIRPTDIINEGNNITFIGDGNVGINTAAPQAKIHVNTTDGKGFQLQDGSQGEGKILMSNADGLATWKTVNATKSIVKGEVETVSSKTVRSYSVLHRTYMDLPVGVWAVNIGQLVTTGQNGTTASSGGWIRFTLTDNNDPNNSSLAGLTHNGFTMQVPSSAYERALVSTTTGSVVTGDNCFAFAAGTIIVTVTGTDAGKDTKRIYLAFELCEFATGGAIQAYNTWVGVFRENYFYALPVND